MRRCAFVIFLACACQKSPYQPFDKGFPVHVIVVAEDVSAKGFRIRPIATLGPLVYESRPRLVNARRPAVEVAIFDAPVGRHRLSVYDRATRIGARTTLKVERETWVVMAMRPGKRTAGLGIHEKPPHDDIGRWGPLVTVPD